jgi:hypothetical protein
MAVLDVEILRGGKPILRDAETRRAVPQDHESARIFIGEGAQQKRAGNAKEGSVRADADGERQNRGDREAGILRECSECVAKVANQAIHREPFIVDDSPGVFGEADGIRRRSQVFVS